MTNDIVALIDYYEKEKGIDREKVLAALEFAFISAYRKMVPGADAIETIRADVDTKKGDTVMYASLECVADDDYVDKFNEVPISLARKSKPDAELGDSVDFNVTPANFGRIATQTAKQTMMQRLRMAEKEMIYDEYKDRAGDIVSGTVRRFEKSDVLVDLGKFEGRIPSRERVVTEDYNIGDRIRVYVVALRSSFPVVTLTLFAVCSNPRSLKSPTTPLSSVVLPVKPDTAPKLLSQVTMIKSIPSAHVLVSVEPA
jgi:N utilization substance protein A